MPIFATPITPAIVTSQAALERRRNVGIILAELGRQRLAGRVDIADVLDDLVTRIEQPLHVVDLG